MGQNKKIGMLEYQGPAVPQDVRDKNLASYETEQARYRSDVEDFLTKNRGAIKRWMFVRPSMRKQGFSYDRLLKEATGGDMKFVPVPDKIWDRYKKQEGLGSKTGAFNRGGERGGEIHFPESRWDEIMPHEVMHNVASHWPGNHGTPKKINPYIKKDMELKGWLPSIHPGGRRPTMPGDSKFSNWWNKNLATQDTEYSDTEHKEGPYHPWFDEHSFDKFGKLHNKTKGDKKMATYDDDAVPQQHPGSPQPRGRGFNMPNMPNLRNSRIYQYLAGTTPGDYEVQAGDTFSEIGEEVGQNWRQIAAQNEFAPPEVQSAPLEAGGMRFPTNLQAGETLEGVRGQGKTLRSDVENVMQMPRNLLDYIRARFAKQPDLSAGGYDNMNAFEGPAYQGYQGQGPPAPSEMTAQEWRASKIPPRKQSNPWARAKGLYENAVWREPDTWRAKAKELYEKAKY